MAIFSRSRTLGGLNMRKIHCDLCQKLIESEKEDYYSIDEISFYTYEEEENSSVTGRTTWPGSFDFCGRCWLSPEFDTLRMLIKKREE